MITTGDDYSWYRELGSDEAGTPTLGNHRDHFEALNVPNPQPGRRYCWEFYSKSHNYSAIIAATNQGWIPVTEEDPEFAQSANARAFLKSAQNTDGLKQFGDVVLMWTPEENYQKLQKRSIDAAQQQLHGVAASHAERGEERARQLRTPPRGRPLYYARGDHQLEIAELEPGRVVDSK